MTPHSSPVPAAVLEMAERLCRRWRARSLLAGTLRAVTVLAGLAIVLLATDRMVDLPHAARWGLRWLPLAGALIAIGVALREARGLRTARDATLWLEGAGADPDHLLTTALEADLSSPVGRVVARRAQARAGALSPATLLPWGLGGPLGRAMGTLGLAVTLAALSPGGLDGARARWFGTHDAGPATRAPTDVPGTTDPAASRPVFTDLALEVVPPPYTALPTRELAPDGAVPVLPGTTLTLRAGTLGGVAEAQRVGVGPLALVTDGAGVRARWRVAPTERGVDLTLRTATGANDVVDRRVVALSVLEDRPPDVVLEAPAEDVVVATATGRLTVRARAVDDYGTGGWALHWVRSSGSGESFSFDEGTWTWDDVARRGDTLIGTTSLDLAATGLGPGDVLHLRAEARDRNDVTGPGVGVSATRLIRVATDDDLGEVTTLVGFPIEREREPILSQRMIILLTERLLAAADTLVPERFASEAAAIADEQDRLRERIEESMFVREAAPDAEPEPADAAGAVRTLELPGHDHDGSPILDVDPDLLVAFNAMWDAGRSLRQAEVRASLPPQHVALEHLQKLREADRVFARGRVERPPLDLDAARGTGEVDEARPVARSSVPAGASAERWLGEIETVARRVDEGDPEAVALALRDLAAALLAGSEGTAEAAAAVTQAATRLEQGEREAARNKLAEAARALGAARTAGRAAPIATPRDALSADYAETRARVAAVGEPPRRAAPSGDEARPTRGAGPVPPFVFATARYRSGDWDSAPLVPSNLAHSLAQYTTLPVEWEGVEVDLSSPELLRYPFVFLTGHLPLRLDAAESANLVRYVERGGFVFIDDHNHDIDGAFHRSVRSELARLFGADALQPLPNGHELYRTFFRFEDGPPITGHELSGWGDGLIHEELFAIERGGRIGVLYSNKDYASEWSYHAENKRFLALDNTRFGVNVLLYALTR